MLKELIRNILHNVLHHIFQELYTGLYIGYRCGKYKVDFDEVSSVKCLIFFPNLFNEIILQG